MASDRLVVSAPLPPSTNNLYYTAKNGRRCLTIEGKGYKNNLLIDLMASGAKKKCPKPPFSLHIHLRFKDKRRADISNRIKVVEDAVFEHIGYDDSLVYDLHVWRYLDRENPGVTVELRHCSRELEAS